MGQPGHNAELLRRFRNQETVRRAADAKGGMTAHGFIDFNLVLTENGGKICVYVLSINLSFPFI